MLFNSFPFIFCFLPIVLGGFYFALRQMGQRAAFSWLVLASLFFYGWWNPAYVFLLLFLMLANFYCGREVARNRSRLWLTGGIALNIAVLAFFKYTDFFIGSVNDVAGTEWPLMHIILPLAISFFTFQKIAFLVDCYRGVAREDHLLDYMLFVSFFPQLIAGPITHYNEVMPQFRRPGYQGADARMMAMGLSLFAIGLFKKAVLADSVAIPSDIVYSIADHGNGLMLPIDAWVGAIAYSLQIYFDFSGYSDMAIGLGLMFGIRLPDNFRSPYQASGSIEFWRRWHMTLSRFLRDYLYIPLGGNHDGNIRQGFNVVVTMLLGGLWHGASWNFVVWGGLHGMAIAINHGLRRIAARMGLRVPAAMQWMWNAACVGMTFIIVTVLWVFFRAETMHGVGVMLGGLTGMRAHGAEVLLGSSKYFMMVGGMAGIALLLPNSMQIMFEPERRTLFWRPTWAVAGVCVCVLLLGLMFMQSHLGKQFIYFDF